jgi:hypothetical protein
MKVQQPNGSRSAGTAGCHHSWPLRALLAVGGWLVVSPLVLSTTRVTAGVVSAVAGGPGVAVLAGRRQGRPATGGGDDQRHADAERR